MKYSLETIKKSWAEIFSSCDLPNGQMAGRLPKMQIIERILFNNRMVNTRIEHQETKKEIAPAGTINSLYKLGMEYHEGKITKQELEKRIDKKFK